MTQKYPQSYRHILQHISGQSELVCYSSAVVTENPASLFKGGTSFATLMREYPTTPQRDLFPSLESRSSTRQVHFESKQEEHNNQYIINAYSGMFTCGTDSRSSRTFADQRNSLLTMMGRRLPKLLPLFSRSRKLCSLPGIRFQSSYPTSRDPGLAKHTLSIL